MLRCKYLNAYCIGLSKFRLNLKQITHLYRQLSHRNSVYLQKLHWHKKVSINVYILCNTRLRCQITPRIISFKLFFFSFNIFFFLVCHQVGVVDNFLILPCLACPSLEDSCWGYIQVSGTLVQYPAKGWETCEFPGLWLVSSNFSWSLIGWNRLHTQQYSCIDCTRLAG